MTALGQIPADGSRDGTVVDEIEQATNAGEQPTGKTLKRDPDVVADVVPEHHPVTFGRTADGGDRVRVHPFVGGCRLCVDHRQDQLRPFIDQPADRERWNVEQGCGYPDVRRMRTHAAREFRGEELFQLYQPEFAALIDYLVRVRGQTLELIQQIRWIGACPRQGKMLTGAPIENGHSLSLNRRAALRSRLVAAQDPVQQGLELTPFSLVKL